MWCVTGFESELATLAARLEAVDTPLHEIRLDALRPGERRLDALEALVRRHGSRLVLCARPLRAGGRWADGDDRERLALLARLGRAGARYVDVEVDVDPALIDVDPERLVVSWHDFASGAVASAPQQLARLADRRAALLKLALQIDDACELTLLRDLARSITRPALVIGMGAAGLLSRVCYRAFGSPFVYVAAAAEHRTAPGQLDRETAASLGLDPAAPKSADDPAWYGLVGGEQVMSSPGMRVYNRLLRARGLGAFYLPIVTRSLAATLPLLTDLGARGLSVTMPLKSEALALAEADTMAREVGAANTLKLVDGGWRARNTDVEGVRAPLAEALAKAGLGRGTRVLLLGSGGAARAALRACQELELHVTLAARRREALDDVVANARGPAPEIVRWEERAAGDHAVLVNATALAATSPWPEGGRLPPVVFDLAIAPRSQLLEDAGAAGLVAIAPLAMWVHQGAAQMSWLLDAPVTPEELWKLA
jgi:3-dehydroquinate dehydratase/shikimate dehydrogenase